MTLGLLDQFSDLLHLREWPLTNGPDHDPEWRSYACFTATSAREIEGRIKE